MSNKVVKFTPQAPIGGASMVRALFSAQRGQIESLLPAHIDPEKMLHGVLAAVNKTPKLLDCTQGSFTQALVSASTLGVDISGVTGEAYLIPFKGKVTLQVGYKGMAKLARQSGSIRRIEAEVVRDTDHWVFVKGTHARLEWAPQYPQGEVIGAYALIEYENGGVETTFMPLEEIEKVRSVSMASDRGPWVDWWDEMAKKTVLKRGLKLSPMTSDRLMEALRHDNEQYDVSRRPASRSDESDALTDRLIGDGVDETVEDGHE